LEPIPILQEGNRSWRKWIKSGTHDVLGASFCLSSLHGTLSPELFFASPGRFLLFPLFIPLAVLSGSAWTIGSKCGFLVCNLAPSPHGYSGGMASALRLFGFFFFSSCFQVWPDVYFPVRLFSSRLLCSVLLLVLLSSSLFYISRWPMIPFSLFLLAVIFRLVFSQFAFPIQWVVISSSW